MMSMAIPAPALSSTDTRLAARRADALRSRLDVARRPRARFREGWTMGRLLVLTVVALATLAPGAGLRAARTPLPQGMQPYTPTKLEWLVLELNSGGAP